MSSKGMRIISQKTTKVAAIGHKNMRIADKAQTKMTIDMRIISKKTTKVAAIGHKNMRIADKAQTKMPIDILNKLAKSTKAFIKKNGIAKIVTK